MKHCYYGSFAPGMQEIVAAAIRERLPGVSIVKLLEGAVLFETDCSYDKLNLFCFNNIFALIDMMDSGPKEPARALESHIKKILTGGGKRSGGPSAERVRAVISGNNKKIKTFRLVCSLENKPASIGADIKKNTEDFIARNSLLKVDRSKPDTEFWFLYRREGFSLFMKRLTRASEKRLRPGELPPQLAWLLCRAGELKPGGTVVDPFCGYGPIPEAALKHFHTGSFFASDTDPRCVKITGDRRSLNNGRCVVKQADVFSIKDFLPQGGVDAVVTDPPWGMHKETTIPLEDFYRNMLGVFLWLLKPGGRATVLTGAREEFESAAGGYPALTVSNTIHILVSGKKAAVYVLVKDPAAVES